MKLRILLKDKNDLLLIAPPSEEVKIGDIIKSNDVLSQVLDLSFADLPGIMEHILRQSLIPNSNISSDIQPEVKTIIESLSDQKLVRTKIRGQIKQNGGNLELLPGLTEFNISREKTTPELYPPRALFTLLNLTSNKESIAHTLGREPIPFTFSLDKMGINLITGQKGSGKSYFSKRLLLKLLEACVFTIVFDVNGEYEKLHLREDGNLNDYAASIRILDTRINTPSGIMLPFGIPLNEITAEQFCDYLGIESDPMAQATYLFWNQNRGQNFSLNEFEQWINDPNNGLNDKVIGGLQSRINYARTLNIFRPVDVLGIIRNLTSNNTGGILVIKLSNLENRIREIIVKLIQKWLIKIIDQQILTSAALFLEEAQMYASHDEIKDLLTRMRHIGIYPTFITNDPQTLPDEVFSLADNLISFRFKSEKILSHLAKTGMVDLDTISTLSNLQPKQCLAVGSFTNFFPLFLEVDRQEGVTMAGETRPLL
jgi:DNA helicase HerA-like ATPase